MHEMTKGHFHGYIHYDVRPHTMIEFVVENVENFKAKSKNSIII